VLKKINTSTALIVMCGLLQMAAAPAALLPAGMTSHVEFVLFFLNLLRDCTQDIWLGQQSERNLTPLKTPMTRNHSQQGSTPDTAAASCFHQSYGSSTCTPDSSVWNNSFSVQSRLSSTAKTPRKNHSLMSTPDVTFSASCLSESCSQSGMCNTTPDSGVHHQQHNCFKQSSTKLRTARGLSPSMLSPQELNTAQHQLHAVKPDSAHHRVLRGQQNSSVLSGEHLTALSSAKERFHGNRALFGDTSTQSGGRKSVGKHKSTHRNWSLSDKQEKTLPVPPSFNLDSNEDFPDMKTSQRYYFCLICCWQ